MSDERSILISDKIIHGAYQKLPNVQVANADIVYHTLTCGNIKPPQRFCEFTASPTYTEHVPLETVAEIIKELAILPVDFNLSDPISTMKAFLRETSLHYTRFVASVILRNLKTVGHQLFPFNNDLIDEAVVHCIYTITEHYLDRTTNELHVVADNYLLIHYSFGPMIKILNQKILNYTKLTMPGAQDMLVNDVHAAVMWRMHDGILHSIS